MIFAFYFLAAALVFLSWKSFRGGLEYLAFFRRELAKPPSAFTPFVSIIAPCRGLDDDLEVNLTALFRQDFPRCEVIFVVDSETDEAVKIINKIIHRRDTENAADLTESSTSADFPGAKLVIAGASDGESQKVHNLREAVLHASPESEVFVFVDSDARPAANWLRDLIAPLRDEKIGCATGYRWFISKEFSLASEMRSVWNASIASALGPVSASNFCWGGSLAVTRRVFERLDLREKLKGTLSDDFTVTRAMKENSLEIFFVPQALTASVENCTYRELFEFTTRQMKITRVYAPSLWKLAFIGAGLFNLVIAWAILILIFYPADDLAFWSAPTALLLISLFSIGKSQVRLMAVKLVLKNYANSLNKQFWTQNTLWILSPALFFYNCVRALLSRRIIWRGIAYRLKSPTETEIIEN